MAGTEAAPDHTLAQASWTHLVEHEGYEIVHGPVWFDHLIFNQVDTIKQSQTRRSDKAPVSCDSYGPTHSHSVLAIAPGRAGIAGSLEWYSATEPPRMDYGWPGGSFRELDGHGRPGAAEWRETVHQMPMRDITFMIRFVRVHVDHRRKGLATAMLKAAQIMEPRVRHSDARTCEGDLWAVTTGDPVPPMHGCQDRPSGRSTGAWEREVRSLWRTLGPDDAGYDALADPYAEFKINDERLRAVRAARRSEV